MDTLRKCLIERNTKLLELLRALKVSALDGVPVPNEDLPNEICLEGVRSPSGLDEPSEKSCARV